MTKINQILTQWLPGDIHSLKWLGERGVAQNVAYEYFKNGSLEKHGPGIYSRKNEKLKWAGAIRLLQEELQKEIHVSGRTALELHGHAHYVPMGNKRIVYLSTYSKEVLPKWFKEIDFDCEFRFTSSVLFPENAELTEYKDELGFRFYISSRELAILELLNVLDLANTFETAENYMNGLQTLRHDVMQDLLEKCTSVKVKRVFLYLAEKLSLAFFVKLDLNKIDLGIGKRQVVSVNGQLDKKYQITVPRDEEENPF